VVVSALQNFGAALWISREAMAVEVARGVMNMVIPYEVRDYVVSSNLAIGLYHGAGDRFYLFQNGTNTLIPELGFWCRAPETDFSPGGRYAAFVGNSDKGLLVRTFDTATGKLRDVPVLGTGSDYKLAWSSREDSFFLRSGKEYWEISLAPNVEYTHHSETPTDFADHYGRVGNTWSRDGVFYTSHENGALKLYAFPSWNSQVIVSRQKEKIMRIKDPVGALGVHQAVFLGGSEVLVEIGDFVYVTDIIAKRIGPVMQGGRFVAFTKAFSKRVDF